MKNTKYNDTQIKQITNIMKLQNNNGILLIPSVRVSYPHIVTYKKDTQYFDCSFLVDKSDTKLIEALTKEIEAFAIKEFGTLENIYLPLKLQNMNNIESEEGGYVFSASSNYDVSAFDKNKNIIPKSDIYGGCWAIVSVKLYAFGKNKEKKGIGLSLRSIMKIYDDNKFGSSKTNDFDNCDFKKFGSVEAATTTTDDII